MSIFNFIHRLTVLQFVRIEIGIYVLARADHILLLFNIQCIAI